MSQIRHRNTTGQTMVVNENENDNIVIPGDNNISAKSLIDTIPQHHGVILKLHVSLIYKILPLFIQRFILNWSFLSNWLGLGPSWKQRYLILCGSYLYKFNNSAPNSKIKGTPFHVETIDVELLSNVAQSDDGFIFPSLPVGYNKIFCVSTLRRQHYYAVLDNTEANIWIQSINETKQEAITRNMGHSKQMPYSKLWYHYDCLTNDIVKRKERIKSRMEESNNRRIISEMEMTPMSIGSSGGTFSRGYYG